MRVEDIHDLARRRVDAIMQECRQGDRLVAQGASGHGLREFGLDLLLAARTPVAVDGVFGGLGLEFGWYVFDNAGTCATHAFQLAAAVGTLRQFMLDCSVDPLGLVA